MKTFDGKNPEAVLRWLVKEGHAVRGGVHRGGPGEDDHLQVEHSSGTVHRIDRGTVVSTGPNRELVVTRAE